MAKKILFPCILFLLLAAAAGPDLVFAGVDPLASPTPQPTGWITAPVISGINPDVVLSEGNVGETHPSDSFSPVDISLPVLLDSPPFVALEPHTSEQVIVDNTPARDFSDVNCGPSALAHALYMLNPAEKIPETTLNQLSSFLAARGLMYDWGTGIEELTFAAREIGFKGSYFFQDWSFEKLAEVLRQAKPVVVSLGTNGSEQPGHFVTLTGISADGDWINIYDPAHGEIGPVQEGVPLLVGNSGQLRYDSPEKQFNSCYGSHPSLDGIIQCYIRFSANLEPSSRFEGIACFFCIEETAGQSPPQRNRWRVHCRPLNQK